MGKRTAATALIVVVLIVCLIGCRGRKTPEQRLAELRLYHEIMPAGATTLNADTEPVLVVDFDVCNTGAVKLNHLTVLVRVTGADHSERLRRRFTLDLSDLRPGVGERRTAVVEGFALADDDEVMVEIEDGLSAAELHGLPEWNDLAGG